MERREGVVPQVKMQTGRKVTQAILIGTDSLLYFTGEIIDAPVGLEVDRGCRTKITVKVDGDAEKLWLQKQISPPSVSFITCALAGITQARLLPRRRQVLST
jgi:hypothetical protein